MRRFWQLAELSVDSVLGSLTSEQANLSAQTANPPLQPKDQISIFEPSSTTELLGNFKKSAAPLAL